MTIQELVIKITIEDDASDAVDSLSSNAIAKGQIMANAFTGFASTVKNAIDKIVGFFGSTIDAYSQYEQLVGGAETLFKGAADTVVTNAQNAFETAGISANQYLEQVNSFANGLVTSIAKSRAGIQSTAEDIKTATTELKRANEDFYTAESRRLSDAVEAHSRALQDWYDDMVEYYSDEEDALKDQQDAEVEAFKQGVDERVQLMTDEYNEKVRLIDEELQAKLAAIDAELAALDKQGDEQAKEAKEREREEKLASLREAVQYAGSIDARVEARKKYNDYVSKIRAEDAKEERKTRREELLQQRKDVKDEAAQKKDDLKKQYEAEVAEFVAAQEKILEQLKASQAVQLEEMRKAHSDSLKEIQRANADELKEMRRANEDALRELKRSQSDQQEEHKAALKETGEYVEKTQEDYDKAAELADTAIKDMADNANKMGTSITRLQDAYQGFNRGEFRMLDNLKLGYGGTKSEMAELLDYAEELAAKQGETADFSIDSFADIIQAIHLVQQEIGASGYDYDVLKEKIENQTLSEQELRRVSQDLWLSRKNGYKNAEEAFDDVVKRYREGNLEIEEATILAGTTSYEASQTIQGAWNAAQGAFENWVISLSDPNGNAEEATKNLVDKIAVWMALIIPRVAQVLETLKEQVIEKAPEIWAKFKEEVLSLIPEEAKQKFKDFIDFITGLAEEIQGAIEFFDGLRQVIEPLVTLFSELGKFIGNVGGTIANFFGGGFQQELEAAASENASTEKLRTLLKNIGKEAGEKLDEGFMEQVENGDLATLTSLAAKVRSTPELNDAMKAAAESSEYQFQTSIQNAFKNGTEEYISEGLPSEIQAAASSGLGKDTLSSNGSDMMSGMKDSMESTYDQSTGPYLKSLSELVKTDATGINADLLKPNGKESVSGLVSGSEEEWLKRREFYQKITPWIYNNDGPLEEHRKLLYEHGRQTILGLVDGSKNAWDKNKSFFSDIPRNTHSTVGNVTSTLLDKGTEILTGFKTGANNVWDGLERWFDSIPDDAFNAIGSVTSTLTSKGHDIIDGLKDGASSAWSYISSWFSGLPNSISNSMGSTSFTLYSAGQDIMDGFRRGLESTWSSIKSWVSSLGSWISSHKGPKQYDLTLLVPNGRWIMEGLNRGMRDAFPLIESTVSDISDMMSVDQSLSFGGMSSTLDAKLKQLPSVNVYLDYNAGEDGTNLVNDMVSQLRLYGYTMGGRQYATRNSVL